MSQPSSIRPVDLPHFRPYQATILVVALAVVIVVGEVHLARVRPPQLMRTVSEVVPECEDRVRVVSIVYTPALTALHGLSLPHLVPLLDTPRSPSKKVTLATDGCQNGRDVE